MRACPVNPSILVKWWTVLGYESDDGSVDALIIRPFERQDVALAQTSPTVFVGKTTEQLIRRIDHGRYDLVDQLAAVWRVRKN